MSFNRRFANFPTQQQILAIEGVVIVDNTPIGSVQGVGTGVVAMVAEFQDMSYAGAWNKATGQFSTKCQPVQIFSDTDRLLKLGGFDETIGDTGNSGGSGYVDMFGKTFAQLVAAPINLASQYGMRLFRKLPTNASAASPIPVVPMQPGSVPAGTEFKSGANRVRTAQRVSFTGDAAFASGVDADVTAAGGAAAHQTLNIPGQDLNALGVQKGDIIVLGVIGAGGAQGANADTYRAAQAPTDAHNIEVEKIDGSAFNWTTGAALAWRIHKGATADSYGSGGSILDAAQQQCLVAARPLDANINANTVIAPTVAQPAPTAAAWSPLSGLGAITGPNQIAYTAAIQAPNVGSSATMDALYQAALNALLQNSAPSNQVDIVVCSRTSTTIRTAIQSHVDTASSTGLGRTAVISPSLNTDNATSTQSTSNILQNASPGVGSARDERVFYAWPGRQISIPSAVGFAMPTADGGTTTDGILDIKSDAWLASIMSVLPSEQNPAQETDAVAAITAPDLGEQRGAPVLAMADYIALKAAGVCAPVQGVNNRMFFESGVTTSLVSGQTKINRRRFADEFEDSIALALKPFAKLPLTDDLKDTEVGEVISYCDGLKSGPNQRIAGYSVDDQSGNTAELLAAGINTIIAKAQMLSDQDAIVLVAQVGPTVKIQQSA